MQQIVVRTGNKSDLPIALKLIRELAIYEKAEQEVINTVEQMEMDGFGSNPIFGFFIAEVNDIIVGLSLYYYRYSTWKGKRLYLEDIIVTEPYRGKGIGKLLFEKTMRKTIEDNCSGMAWQVLEWNEPSINFYKKYSAKMDSEWVNCNLEATEIKSFLNL
jgi:GNAT superfamily N-acetyltransferase